MNESNKVTKSLTSLFRNVTAVFMLFFMGVLSVQSLLGTTGMETVDYGQGVYSVVQTIREHVESVVFYSDNVITNLIWLVVFFLVLYLSMPFLKKFSLRAELIMIAVWTIAIGFLWIGTSNVAPTHDSLFVSRTALEFAKDDYYELTAGGRYFRDYPFQLGFVFFEEIFIRIARLFGEVENFLFIQRISAVMLASSYVALLLMLDSLFKDKRIRHTAFFLLMFCIQPVISCTFLYGIIPGFTFAVWAVYFEIRFIKSGKLRTKIISGILSVLFITCSVVVKTNNLIVLVAMVALYAVTAFRDKKSLINLVLSAVCIVLCSVSPKAVESMYEKRSDSILGDSVPMISWFDMGLREAENAPGWFNRSATIDNLASVEFNKEKATELSKNSIKSRIKEFRERPQYCNDFFFKKYMSVWNETSYQSIWNNTVREQYSPKTFVAKWACGDGKDVTKYYMDLFAQFVFLLAFFGILYCMKQKNTCAMIIPLIVLGGMLYHLLAEAKSQYALPYFILITVFASCGFVFVYDRAKPYIRKFLKAEKA